MNFMGRSYRRLSRQYTCAPPANPHRIWRFTANKALKKVLLLAFTQGAAQNGPEPIFDHPHKGVFTMTPTRILTATALAGILTLAGMAGTVEAKDKAANEKCYGIVKAGQNDCHAPGHSCAGSGTVDSDPAEWVMMPQGLCEKLVGASLMAPKTPSDAAPAEEAAGASEGHTE
jgi:uncharacterized membrane protein